MKMRSKRPLDEFTGTLGIGVLVAAVGVVSVVAGPVSAGTIMVRVNAANDDAEENLNDNSIDLGSSDLELGNEGEGNPQLVGMRFANVNVPQGATVLSASLQFTVDEGDRDSGPTDLTITGELTSNALAFTATAGDITSRGQTTAAAAWNSVAPWDTDGHVTAAQRSPDIASVVQEIVDQPGWAAGNALVILIQGSGERTAASFNGEQNGAPILIITTTGGPHERLFLRRVVHGNDDVEQDAFAGGNIDLSSSDLEISAEGGST